MRTLFADTFYYIALLSPIQRPDRSTTALDREVGAGRG